MCTYLKNMEGWKPKSLKNKSFANIQELFEKAMKRVNTFIDYRTELVKESSKKAEIKLEENLKKAKAEVSVWNGIGVNVGDSKLMILGISLLLLVKVNAARHKLTTAGES
ncbi:hypothetical protein Tco_0003702 [Tanacetum coccineum]